MLGPGIRTTGPPAAAPAETQTPGLHGGFAPEAQRCTAAQRGGDPCPCPRPPRSRRTIRWPLPGTSVSALCSSVWLGPVTSVRSRHQIRVGRPERFAPCGHSWCRADWAAPVGRDAAPRAPPRAVPPGTQQAVAHAAAVTVGPRSRVREAARAGLRIANTEPGRRGQRGQQTRSGGRCTVLRGRAQQDEGPVATSAAGSRSAG